MKIRLDYGKTGLEVEIPDRNLVGPLQLKPCQPLARPDRQLAHVLAHPTGSPPLAALARGRRSACILICDITRPVPNELLLGGILATLQQAGVPRDAVRVLIATGMHRPNEGAEIVELVGAEIAANYRVENHFGKRLVDHQYLGS